MRNLTTLIRHRAALVASGMLVIVCSGPRLRAGGEMTVEVSELSGLARGNYPESRVERSIFSTIVGGISRESRIHFLVLLSTLSSQFATALVWLSLAVLPLIGAENTRAQGGAAKGGPTGTADPDITQRNDVYARQLEDHLVKWLIDEYPERSQLAWHRDYSSLEAFERSVAPNREHWRHVLSPPTLKKTGPLARRPHPALADIKAEWVVLPLGDLTAEGVLVFPASASPQSPVPLVIAQHGISSTPESTFSDPNAGYHAYARELLRAGFAVLAPLNLRAIPSRDRIERLTRLARTSLPGIEFSRLQNLLDVVLADPRIDPDRVGMWGLSLGGMATMFFMPLEPRIKVGIVSGWFNHRLNKMAKSDTRYSSFLDKPEEHAFFNGWLTEFADYDAITLICPRPVLIQHGKQDRISYWPDLVKEYDASKAHYEKLGIGDRIGLDLHEGWHEARPDTGIPFLKRWLKRR